MEKTRTLETSKFELTSEIEIVRLLLHNEIFTAAYSNHLSPSLFREQLRVVVEIALKYWKQYGKLVSMEAMIQELRFKVGTNLTQEKLNSVLEVLLRLKQEPTSPEYTEEQVSNFIKFQRTENALIKSLKTLTEAEKNKNPAQLKEITELVVKASEDFKIKRSSYWLGGIDARTEFREKIERGEIDYTGFGTGIPEIDELCFPRYGIGPGEIGFYIGATGRGKSIALLLAALTAAIKGFPVAYLSFELSEANLMDRADSSISKTEISHIVKERETVRQYIEDLKNDQSHQLADIGFCELPCAGQTVMEIKNQLKMMKQLDNFIPRLLIVDYVDLLQPIRKVKEGGWKEQQVVTQELRGLGEELNMGVWTASQGNRGAAQKNEEGGLLGDSDVAESYTKLGVADLVITINRTKTQMSMPEPKPAWLRIVKNRNGIGDRKVGILTDFGKMSFYEGPYLPTPDMEEMEEQAMNSPAIKRKKYGS